MSSGKGDRTRPKSVSYNEWSKKYEAIFGKKDKNKKKKNDQQS